ncbi:MAG: hypothetical protein Q8P07_00690 [bacterium]|nr:hypothetical protein [bacterium]
MVGLTENALLAESKPKNALSTILRIGPAFPNAADIRAMTNYLNIILATTIRPATATCPCGDIKKSRTLMDVYQL